MTQQKLLCAQHSFKLGIALQEKAVISRITSLLNVFPPVFISYAVDVLNLHVAMLMCALTLLRWSAAILLSLGIVRKVPIATSVTFMNAPIGLTQDFVTTSGAIYLMLTEQDKSESTLLLLTI